MGCSLLGHFQTWLQDCPMPHARGTLGRGSVAGSSPRSPPQPFSGGFPYPGCVYAARGSGGGGMHWARQWGSLSCFNWGPSPPLVVLLWGPWTQRLEPPYLLHLDGPEPQQGALWGAVLLLPSGPCSFSLNPESPGLAVSGCLSVRVTDPPSTADVTFRLGPGSDVSSIVLLSFSFEGGLLLLCQGCCLHLQPLGVYTLFHQDRLGLEVDSIIHPSLIPTSKLHSSDYSRV
ncbi:unnamed protein product [Lepidochelys kempii]